MTHQRWKTVRERKLTEGFTEPDEVAEARREIQLSMVLAEAVYNRRIELGQTQRKPSPNGRAGLPQVVTFTSHHNAA